MASTNDSGSDKNVSEAEAYYKLAVGPEAQKYFFNLDDATCFTDLLEDVRNYDTRNFVLDFSDAAAMVAFDLSTPQIDVLVNTERPELLNTRWVNIWRPQYQGSLIELLAKRYDFSPRLLALMISDPRQTRDLQHNVPQERLTGEHFQSSQPRQGEDEAEKCKDALSEVSTVSSEDSVATGNLYKIIDDMWHYSSIDFGRKYVCLGYNSIHGSKTAGEVFSDDRLPQCARLWTWLIICDDSTVISINEDPFPFSDGKLSVPQRQILAETRRNLINVFRSLSKTEGSISMARRPLGTLPIRTRLGNSPEETAHRLTDMPGLLFYYLFENWHNSYALITRRETRYRIELKALRTEMFDKPKLCHIDRLDNIGNELGILKHHFESYLRLIHRLLEPKMITNASLQNYRIGTQSSHASLDTIRQIITEHESTLGVSLSSPARVRFERLKDLIELYALSEVNEFIKQKDSLVAMNLQLIGIKESLDVERLTRVTLLLTKLTMVFLPVSLITAYFDTPLGTVSYTLQEYWITVVVAVILSCSALFVFGVFSGSVQTLPFWTGLWKAMKNAGNWFHRHSETFSNA